MTGNAFTYGLLTAGEQTGGSGSMTYTNRTVSVENSSGASQAYITGKTVRSGTMGGIAVSSEGKAVEVVSLKKADVSRLILTERRPWWWKAFGCPSATG